MFTLPYNYKVQNKKNILVMISKLWETIPIIVYY